MKTRKIHLAFWEETYESENIDVDWPRIQRELGQDHLEWLLSLPHERGQLMVERSNGRYNLVAEFYDDVTAVDYHLRWAK
jgi:hypothetical protein